MTKKGKKKGMASTAEWVTCDFVLTGTPFSLTKSQREGKLEENHDFVLPANAQTKALRVARLPQEKQLAFVARVLEGFVDDSWFDETEKERKEECTSPLETFLSSLTPHSMTIEVGSVLMAFTDKSKADQFRALDALAKSVVCAAFFDATCPKERRKSVIVPVTGQGMLQWCEFPKLKHSLREVRVMDDWFACETVPLPMSMDTAAMRGAARSMASHLHVVQRHDKCEARTWILSDNGPDTKGLVIDKLLGGPVRGLEGALLDQGWTAHKGFYKFKVPCFVLIFPKALRSALVPWFHEILDFWKLRSRSNAIMLRSMPWQAREGRKLKAVAQDAGDLDTATELCLRGADLDEVMHFEQLKQLVDSMKMLKHLDVAFNSFGGKHFCEWFMAWLSVDLERTINITGLCFAERMRDVAEATHPGLSKRVIID